MTVSGELAGLRIGLLTSAASRLGGGVFEAVIAHSAMIRAHGGDALVFALEDAHSAQDGARLPAGTVNCLPVSGPAQVGFAPGLVDALLRADLDCLHLHGIWMYPSRAGTLWARATGRPYVISPHGMLDPWITGRGRWKKALARAGYERASWRAAATLHALTGREAADIRNESGRDDAVVIANAGPPPGLLPGSLRDAEFLYLGRIHPKKNLTALIRAWRALDEAGKLGAARLTIAGWGADEDVADLERQLAQAPASARFVGPAFGDAKETLLSTARFAILPSLSEGLPMAVLEAWAKGTPVIMTSECNLPEGFSAGAAMECGFDEASIAQALAQALALDEAGWRHMANAAHTLAKDAFSETFIAALWAETYKRLIAASPAKRHLAEVRAA